MSQLFDVIKIRGLEFPNRIGISPMCQYSAEDGLSNDWHLVHLGSRASGGAGLILVEATAVSPEGRISPQDLGLWKDEHIEGLARITRFVRSQGTRIGIQLAHAGRKGSDPRPWDSTPNAKELKNGWATLAPSAIAFSDDYPVPQEMNLADIKQKIADFSAAAKRAVAAGFEFVEIHGAHGYLLHEFLSPISNHRTDEYGGSFSNRTLFLKEVVKGVRDSIPDSMPLFVRLSVRDWLSGGWTVDDSIALARELRTLGVDLIDCSSGAIAPGEHFPSHRDYQVELCEKVKKEAGILTAAVGSITDPEHANEITERGKGDLILLARESLREPYWPQKAAKKLSNRAGRLPEQYAWAISE